GHDAISSQKSRSGDAALRSRRRARAEAVEALGTICAVAWSRVRRLLVSRAGKVIRLPQISIHGLRIALDSYRTDARDARRWMAEMGGHRGTHRRNSLRCSALSVSRQLLSAGQ